jgi:hypothetical protein
VAERASEIGRFFVLRFFHDYGVEEIADIVNLSCSAVMPGLSRMRAEVQHYLREQEEAQSSAEEAKSLVSGYKSNRFNWLQIPSKSLSQSIS